MPTHRSKARLILFCPPVGAKHRSIPSSLLPLEKACFCQLEGVKRGLYSFAFPKELSALFFPCLPEGAKNGFAPCLLQWEKVPSVHEADEVLVIFKAHNPNTILTRPTPHPSLAEARATYLACGLGPLGVKESAGLFSIPSCRFATRWRRHGGKVFFASSIDKNYQGHRSTVKKSLPCVREGGLRSKTEGLFGI